MEHCDERVEALAQFQQSCILQALRFPALRRLVYSTCRSDRQGAHSPQRTAHQLDQALLQHTHTHLVTLLH